MHVIACDTSSRPCAYTIVYYRVCESANICEDLHCHASQGAICSSQEMFFHGNQHCVETKPRKGRKKPKLATPCDSEIELECSEDGPAHSILPTSLSVQRASTTASHRKLGSSNSTVREVQVLLLIKLWRRWTLKMDLRFLKVTD